MNKKKILSLIMALVMLVGVFSPLSALAAEEKEPTKIKVNVHKILISDTALGKHDKNKKYDPTKGIDNIKDFFGDDNAKEINDVYFVAIKGASNGVQAEAGYDDFDSKTREEQDAILEKIPSDRQGKTKNGGVIQFELDNPGNYKIYEVKHKSTYKGPNGEVLTGMKAIPVDLKLPEHARTEAGVQGEIHVYPKNSEKKIQFDKNFKANNDYEVIKDDNNLLKTGADVEKYNKEKAEAKAFIGKEIEYESLAKLPKGSVFTSLDLEDSMDKGLKYKSADKVTITVTPALTNALAETTDYTITDASNGFKLVFTDAGLKKLNDAAKNSDLDIKFTYKATVTADAINDQPMDNHITLRYNHKTPTPSSETITPKNGEIKVSKTWADADGKTTDSEGNTISAPAGARVTYMLLDANDKPVADVTFTAARTVDNTDLGNGIKFNVTGDFAGTFSGLKGTGYKVKEIVDGYEAGYTVNNDDGTVTIKNTKTPNSITPTPPKVTVGGKRFVKIGESDTRLAGAEFVIKNSDNKFLKINGSGNQDAYITAETAYNDAIQAVNEALKKGEISDKNKVKIGKDEYSTKDAAMTKVAELEKSRNEEFVKASLTYTWVATTAEATKFNTNEYGQFEVTGLAYGNYSAIETKAPAGYALPTDGGNFTFTVEKGSYKNDTVPMDYKIKVTENEKVVEKVDGQGKKITNTKVTNPQTGGIGTVIFTVVGISLMAGAVMAMKKNREEA